MNERGGKLRNRETHSRTARGHCGFLDPQRFQSRNKLILLTSARDARPSSAPFSRGLPRVLVHKVTQARTQEEHSESPSADPSGSLNSSMSLPRLARLSRRRALRSFATATEVQVKSPLSGLAPIARERAEQLSANWKGTSASGESTKNFIGGQFVESKADKYTDVLDPVREIMQTIHSETSLTFSLYAVNPNASH